MKYDEDQCHICLMIKGSHTRKCYYDMYIQSGKLDFKEMFE